MKREALAALILVFAAPTAWSQDPPKPDAPKPAAQEPDELTELSLEELMQIEITSVSKGQQKLLTAAAAITVIRGDDLRRTGVTTIPEALRMVPGVNVAKVDSNKWAVTSRGFNSVFANKLLVLIDGRSVYDPLFSGVFWSSQHVLLEDIERIEVIRGPGATVWGANAVNGVINIITKQASDTQGAYLSAGAGNEERFLSGARWGGKMGEDTFYRVYAKYADKDDGKHGDDSWNHGQAGFRVDHAAGDADRLTFQGDYYQSRTGNRITAPAAPPVFLRTYDFDAPLSGGNLLMRWDHDFSPEDQFSAQIYYDHTELDYRDIMSQRRDTFDMELQHRFEAGWGQTFTIGGGYRWTQDDLGSTFLVSTMDEHRTDQVASAFIQDEIELWEDHLTLTLGSKFEYNSYTGFEYQPGARLSWKIDGRNALWASATRAIRSPSRIDHEIQFVQAVVPPVLPNPFPTFVTVFGDERFVSEKLHAFELGYRVLPTDTLSVDLATFVNVYDDLRTIELGTVVPGPPTNLQPLTMDNKAEGTSYGAELAVNWQVLPEWRLYAAYSALKINLDVDNDSTSMGTQSDETTAPRNQFYLRSSFDLPQNIQFDAIGRYVDVVPNWNIDSYIEVDLRLGWRPTKNLELAVVGQNLYHDDHLEGVDNQFNFHATEIERGFYFSATLRF